MEKRVAIIGAGISGLLACKYTLSKGLRPIVFESQDQVGGLWTRTVESTRVRNVKGQFQFSDFPWHSSVKETFPKSTQLLEYLQSYANHFQLLPCINFDSEVICIDYVGASEEEMEAWELWNGVGKPFGSKGKWTLKVHHTKEDSTKEYMAEFVILCVGRFSGLPDIPKFTPGYGPEVFSGKVLHSMDYAAMDNEAAAKFIKGKTIAIVGSGNSSVDIAFECAQANGTDNPCTIIQRTTRWMIPDGDAWGINFSQLFFNRFNELTVHKPNEDFLSNMLTTFLSPLRFAMSKFVESYLKWKLPLQKYDMIPKQSFVQELSSCQVGFLPNNFYDKVEEGSIVFKKSPQFSFCEEGLNIDREANPIKADIVIFATGYKGYQKLKNIFASPTFRNCIAGTPTSILPLYRQVIHPRVPQLAVIGYSESLSNLYTFEIRCQWLSHLLDQTFHLPSIKEMEDDVRTWERYMRREAPDGKFRRACVGGLTIWHNDQLCKDIGCNTRRKKGVLPNLFQPYGLADYEGLAPGF